MPSNSIEICRHITSKPNMFTAHEQLCLCCNQLLMSATVNVQCM